jgi:hypothetical protein
VYSFRDQIYGCLVHIPWQESCRCLCVSCAPLPVKQTTIVKAPAGFGKTIIGFVWGLIIKLIWVHLEI